MWSLIAITHISCLTHLLTKRGRQIVSANTHWNVVANSNYSLSASLTLSQESWVYCTDMTKSSAVVIATPKVQNFWCSEPWVICDIEFKFNISAAHIAGHNFWSSYRRCNIVTQCGCNVQATMSRFHSDMDLFLISPQVCGRLWTPSSCKLLPCFYCTTYIRATSDKIDIDNSALDSAQNMPT